MDLEIILGGWRVSGGLISKLWIVDTIQLRVQHSLICTAIIAGL
jgi:hypothetical protein